MLAAETLTHHRKFTKSVGRSQHDRTNLIQRDWTGYTSSNHSDLHKRFCGEWLVMWAGVGILWWKVRNMWKALEREQG